ncbi:hypothetical protein [Marinobacter algicola]
MRAGDELARMVQLSWRHSVARLKRVCSVRMGTEPVAQREAEKQAVEVLIAQRREQLGAAHRRLASSEELAAKDAVQCIILASPNTHFVVLAQAILYRGAGFTPV